MSYVLHFQLYLHIRYVRNGTFIIHVGKATCAYSIITAEFLVAFLSTIPILTLVSVLPSWRSDMEAMSESD